VINDHWRRPSFSAFLPHDCTDDGDVIAQSAVGSQ
jgi:hypothetical protein